MRYVHAHLRKHVLTEIHLYIHITLASTNILALALALALTDDQLVLHLEFLSILLEMQEIFSVIFCIAIHDNIDYNEYSRLLNSLVHTCILHPTQSIHFLFY